MHRLANPRHFMSKEGKRIFRSSSRSSANPDAKTDKHGFKKVPFRGDYTREKCDMRRKWVETFSNTTLPSLNGWWDSGLQTETDVLRGNIEAPIGLVRIPIGVAGPLFFNGTNAKGFFLAPMATTEGALVASTTRGATAINASGGVTTHAGIQKTTRAPMFLTGSPEQATVLAEWLSNPELVTRLQEDVIQKHSNFAKLKQIFTLTDIEAVHALFVYSSGDAAGQNMTTTTTWEAIKWINHVSQAEISRDKARIVKYWIEGGWSGDKRSTFSNLLHGRGTCASASAVIPDSVLRDVLNIDSQGLLDYCIIAHRMGEKVGGHGSCGNVSNIVAAVFTATGQDIACVAESSQAQLSIDHHTVNGEHGIKAQIQLPSLMVGTVGGGTSLPTQKDCLSIIDCYGTGKREKLAEIIAGYCLALDLSTLAALASNEFALAHERLGRNRPPPPSLSKDSEPSK